MTWGRGDPLIDNQGALQIGARFFLDSLPARSHLAVGPAATLRIGDDVRIAHGASISAQVRVEIGDGARIGPFVMIVDSDYHSPGEFSDKGKAAPIFIGAGARIGARVTLLRGAKVGAGAVVEAGSVVSGIVPAGARYGGIPARPVTAARSPS